MPEVLATDIIAASGIAASAQAHGLFAALIDFMQPIIQSYICSSGRGHPSNDNSPPGRPRDINEGQQLLNSLKEFIAANVDLHLASQAESSNVKDEHAKERPITCTTVALRAPPTIARTPSEDIQTRILTELRPHIANKMPIRLLAFDASGAHMELVERNEMFRRILQRAYAAAAEPQFQADWADASSLRRSTRTVAAWMAERRRKAGMITALIERHARYAILSHTWIRDAPGDVVYRDWGARGANPRGARKIASFCAVAAARHGVRFGWVDSVCIDKASSSELDESIRSMYKWYRGAHVCIAHLAGTRALKDMDRDAWFSRGWTLQELLAPRDVRFYTMDWEDLHDAEPALDPAAVATMIQQKIEWATTITHDEMALCRRGETDKIPICRRLQLAARREVTREEDAAYSLMGLLGVDISVAYGEGAARASFRLLRELLGVKKHVLDIFNHGYRNASGNTLIPSTIREYLYRSAAFDVSGSKTGSSLNQWQPLEPILLTHLGVRVPLLLLPSMKDNSDPAFHEHYAPKGDFSGNVMLYQYQKSYNLLDSRIYADDQLFSPITSVYEDENAPSVVTFGVLNFSMEKDDILLPQQCFSVPLDCGSISPGDVRSSDTIKIMKTVTAEVFQLKSAKKKDRIPKDELGKHGIQLVTLYL